MYGELERDQWSYSRSGLLTPGTHLIGHLDPTPGVKTMGYEKFCPSGDWISVVQLVTSDYSGWIVLTIVLIISPFRRLGPISPGVKTPLTLIQYLTTLLHTCPVKIGVFNSMDHGRSWEADSRSVEEYNTFPAFYATRSVHYCVPFPEPDECSPHHHTLISLSKVKWSCPATPRRRQWGEKI